MKTCSKCKKTKELTEFHKNKRTKDGYRTECCECKAEQAKLYYENNKEKIAEREKLYRQNNKEKEAERHKLYYENNKEKGLLKGARRRAKEKGLPFSITEEDIAIPEICPVLGIPLFIGEGKIVDNSPNLDRIIPEKGYVPDNIRVISAKANRIKSNATAEEIRLVWEDLQKIDKGLL